MILLLRNFYSKHVARIFWLWKFEVNCYLVLPLKIDWHLHWSPLARRSKKIRELYL